MKLEIIAPNVPWVHDVWHPSLCLPMLWTHC